MAAKEFVILTHVFRRIGKNRWIARCVELGTSTHGRTLPQVRDEIVEMVTLHLSTLEEVGERERVFRENGIKTYPSNEAPVRVSTELEVGRESFAQAIRIPISVTARANNDAKLVRV